MRVTRSPESISIPKIKNALRLGFNPTFNVADDDLHVFLTFLAGKGFREFKVKFYVGWDQPTPTDDRVDLHCVTVLK